MGEVPRGEEGVHVTRGLCSREDTPAGVVDAVRKALDRRERASSSGLRAGGAEELRPPTAPAAGVMASCRRGSAGSAVTVAWALGMTVRK